MVERRLYAVVEMNDPGRVHNGMEGLTRAMVYGRHRIGGEWVVVYMPARVRPDGTVAAAADRAAWWEPQTEPNALTWGGEPLKVRSLPVVNADGEPEAHPGWVRLGSTGRGRKCHVWLYGLDTAPADRTVARSMCKRVVRSGGVWSAAWFMTTPEACRTCQRHVMDEIARV